MHKRQHIGRLHVVDVEQVGLGVRIRDLVDPRWHGVPVRRAWRCISSRAGNAVIVHAAARDKVANRIHLVGRDRSAASSCDVDCRPGRGQGQLVSVCRGVDDVVRGSSYERCWQRGCRRHLHWRSICVSVRVAGERLRPGIDGTDCLGRAVRSRRARTNRGALRMESEVPGTHFKHHRLRGAERERDEARALGAVLDLAHERGAGSVLCRTLRKCNEVLQLRRARLELHVINTTPHFGRHFAASERAGVGTCLRHVSGRSSRG